MCPFRMTPRSELSEARHGPGAQQHSAAQDPARPRAHPPPEDSKDAKDGTC